MIYELLGLREESEEDQELYEREMRKMPQDPRNFSPTEQRKRCTIIRRRTRSRDLLDDIFDVFATMYNVFH